MDSDTVDFNHVFSSYLEIVNAEMAKENETPPDIMSTGYIFPEHHDTYGEGMLKASQICRKIRAITAQHIPLGTYYPEPNFCILIKPEYHTVSESFLHLDMPLSNQESRVIIKNMKQNRGNLSAIFSFEGNPLITQIPVRCNSYKSGDKENPKRIQFSHEFMGNGEPNLFDLGEMRNMSQHNLNPQVWFSNLTGNGALVLLKKQNVFNSLMNKMRRERYHQNTNLVVNNLIKEVLDETPECRSLWSACTAVGEYISIKFSRYNVRSRISHILQEHAVEIAKKKNRRLAELTEYPKIFQLLQFDCAVTAITTLHFENLYNLARVVESDAPDLDSCGYTIDDLKKVTLDSRLREPFITSPIMDGLTKIRGILLGGVFDMAFISNGPTQALCDAAEEAASSDTSEVMDASKLEGMVEHALENYAECINYTYINDTLEGEVLQKFIEIFDEALWKMGEEATFKGAAESQEIDETVGDLLGYGTDVDSEGSFYEEQQGLRDYIDDLRDN